MSPPSSRRPSDRTASFAVALVATVGLLAVPARAEVTQVKTLPVSEVFERLAGEIPEDASEITVRLSFTDASDRPLPDVTVELVDGKDPDERRVLDPAAPGVYVVELDRRMVRRSSDLILSVEGYRGLVRTDLAPAGAEEPSEGTPAEASTAGMTAVEDPERPVAVLHRDAADRARETLATLVAAHDGIRERIGAAAGLRVVLREGSGTARSGDPDTWVWAYRHEPRERFLFDAIHDWVERSVAQRVFLRADRKNRWIVEGLVETVSLDVLVDLGLGDEVAGRVERRIERGVEPLGDRSPATWDLNDFQWDRARGFVLEGDRSAVEEHVTGRTMALAFWRKLVGIDPDLPRAFLDAAVELRPSQRKNRRLVETLGELTGGSYVLEVQSFTVAEARAHLEAYAEAVR